MESDSANSAAQSPLPQVPRAPSLRRVEHPDLSAALTHFCIRGRRQNDRVPPRIQELNAPQRLESILWDGHLKAFVSFCQGDPVVCFTESTWAGITFLLKDRPYQPWGLVVDRDSVYDAGGGPVWYARPTEYNQLQQSRSHLRPWTVRLGEGSDWLEEREWRIPRALEEPETFVALSELKLVGLLVGDPNWTGARWAHCVAADTGQARWGHFFPPSAKGLLRFWWDANGAQLRILPPLFQDPGTSALSA